MSGKTEKMTAAKALVSCMTREAIQHVFCVPGESYLSVLDALYNEPSIEVITARHESGAAFMADSYGKETLKPGIVLATRGVGAANLSIGVHTAFQDSTPMVVFLGQVHRDFRGREGFQEVDLDRYFQPIAKWAVEVSDPKRMPEIVQRAFRVAQSGRPGPVVISLPEDVLPAEAEMQFAPPVTVPTPAPSSWEINRVAKLLKQATSPLIIAGGGVKSARAEEALINFAEKSQLPVMAAFRRHDVFPNDHPLYAGHLGLGTDGKVLQTVRKADVIIALGTRLSEVTTQDYSIMTPAQQLIHIDIDFSTLGKVYVPDVGIIADAAEALLSLSQIHLDKVWPDWAAERREAYAESSRIDVGDTDTINKHVIAMLVEKLPKDAVLTTDAGNFANWLHAYYPFIAKHTYIGPTSGAMGYGMPAALGAKLAASERMVISLSGDGGFMMTVQELETAVRNKIPVICLVFNNNMYGTIRMHQEMHFPKNVIATDLGDVSFADLARSAGAEGYTVRTKDDFDSVFAQVLQQERTKPVVIEIITEQEQVSVSSTISGLRR